MNKKLIRNLALGSIFTFAALGLSLRNNFLHLPFQAEVHNQNVINFQDDKALVGASHNIFVGRVLKQVGTKTRTQTPETQFSVEVVHNIKGNLKGNVVVDQFGGYKNGVLFVVEGDLSHEVLDADSQSSSRENGLLEVGKTYLFATRYSVDEQWYTLISDSAAKKLMSEKNLTVSELKNIAQKDSRVLALQNAYKNEILLDVDVATGNTFNSYASLNKK